MKEWKKKHTVKEADYSEDWETDVVSEMLVMLIQFSDDDTNKFYYIPLEEFLRKYNDKDEINWDYAEDQFNRIYYYLGNEYILENSEIASIIRKFKYDNDNHIKGIPKKQREDILQRIFEHEIDFLKDEYNDFEYIKKYFLKGK